jgi:hypothetical protein
VAYGSAFDLAQLTGPEKTSMLDVYILEGAVHPLVRRVAVDLVRSAPRDDHRERLARLHRFVQWSIPYHRETIEMFHPAGQVLLEGGDCDDHVILLCSLAWALRYPWSVEPIGHPDGPAHYTCRLGYPPADEPHGDGGTRWASYETTIDARPGEHVMAAIRRLGL